MTLAPKLVLGAGGLAVLLGGGLLWAEYGALVFFDMLASAFIGCFI